MGTFRHWSFQKDVNKLDDMRWPSLRLHFMKICVVVGLIAFALLSYFGRQYEREINPEIPGPKLQILSSDMSTSIKGLARGYNEEASTRSRCDMSAMDNPEDPRFYNIMLEDEALKYEPCNDDKLSASPEYSTVVVNDETWTSYGIGETIRARVDLYDGYRNKKHSGGDMIRATIHDMQDYHHAPGVVTDNLDGSYTVEVKAFWSGQSVIKVMLAYTREVVSAIYRLRTQVLSTRNVYAKFTSGKYAEDVLCHPNHTRLLTATNNSELCDLTMANSGMSFYCLKPKNIHLLCLDWMYSGGKKPDPVLPLTSCETTLFKKTHKELRQRMIVNISENTMCRILPEQPCSKYDVTNTWTSRQPTGYFTDKKWNNVQCQGLSQDGIDECMKNKRLYLIGDSTLRQWYSNIVERKNCTQITEKWTVKAWHKPAECLIKNIGFKAGWYIHSQPFNNGPNYENARYASVSIVRRIESIPNEESAIVVFQLYMHFLAFHHTVAQNRLVLIRKTVENFLKRNKRSVVLIKGPHTFSEPSGSRYNDCQSGLYTKILYDTFNGLHDRVVLLNNRDATLAGNNRPNHPSENIVSAMVDQMFSFACK